MILLSTGTAFSNGSEKKIPATLNPGLNHILDMVTPGSTVSFNPEAITPVLDFVASAKNPDEVFVSDDSFKSPSAYIEMDLNQGLADLFGWTAWRCASGNSPVPEHIYQHATHDDLTGMGNQRALI